MGLRLGFHLGYGGADDAEDAVEVGPEGASPLLRGHFCDGGVMRGPNAVVEDGAVEAAEGGDCSGDEGLTVLRGGERLVDGAAEVGAAALPNEGFGLLGGGAVAEDDPCAGLTEEADGGSADSTGASGDEGDFSHQ